MYSDNFAEFGAPINASVEAARAIGLDWFAVTDHSFDFDSDAGLIDLEERPQDHVDEKAKWLQYVAECSSVDSSDLKCLAGEEISVMNARGRFIHLLGYGLEGLPWAVPGDGDGGAWTIDLSPLNQYLGNISVFPEMQSPYELNYDRDADGIEDTAYTPTLGEAIGKVSDVGGFTYLAHPVSHLRSDSQLLGRSLGDYVNYGVLHRDGVQPADYARTDYTGLEVWNGNSEYSRRLRDEGMLIWNRLLLKNLSRRTFIVGGTDAHGDFNFYRGAAGEESDNAFGRVQTCCKLSSFTKSNLYSALRGGSCYMTDGPALDFRVEGSGNVGWPGETVSIDSGGWVNVTVFYRSSVEFGGVDFLRVCRGKKGGVEERCVTKSLGGSLEGKRSFDDVGEYPWLLYVGEDSYFRVEVVTVTGHRAYSNPVWVEMVPAVRLRLTLAPVTGEALGSGASGEGYGVVEDGNFGPGERVEFSVVVENHGALDAEGVEARIMTPDSPCIVDYRSSYTDEVPVDAGQSQQIDGLFVDLSDDPEEGCTGGETLSIPVKIRDAGTGETVYSRLNITLSNAQWSTYDLEFRNLYAEKNIHYNESATVKLNISRPLHPLPGGGYYGVKVDEAHLYYRCGNGFISDHGGGCGHEQNMYRLQGQLYEWKGTIHPDWAGREDECEGETLYWRVKALARHVEKENSSTPAKYGPQQVFWSPFTPYGIGEVLDDDTSPPQFTFPSTPGEIQPDQEFVFHVGIEDPSGVLDDDYHPAVYYRWNDSKVDEDTYDGLMDLDWNGSSYVGVLNVSERFEGKRLYWRVYASDEDNTPEYARSAVQAGPRVLPTPPTIPLVDSTSPATYDGNRYSLLLNWSDAADGSGIHHYDVHQNGTANATYTTPLSLFNVTDLLPGVYTFRVRAVDNAGTSGNWSEDASFNLQHACTGTYPPTAADWTITQTTTCHNSIIRLEHNNLHVEHDQTLFLKNTTLTLNHALTTPGQLHLHNSHLSFHTHGTNNATKQIEMCRI